jgi:PAS domain S-box-containing protein
MITKPQPIDSEIHVLSGKTPMIKTDVDAIMEYANDYFLDLSEYKAGDLMGESLLLITHPDMPKTILDLAWKQILSKKTVSTIIKFISKTGKYFWLQVRLDFKVDENTRDIKNIYYYGAQAPITSKLELTKLYDKLSKIEKESSLELSEKYFNNYLENLDLDYNTFFEKHVKF